MKKANIATTVLFSLFLASFAFINIFTPVRHFSELENRYLAQRPNFTLRNLRLGRFTEGFENFVTDQFFLRDQWVLLKSDLERLTLKRENNGIFIGTHGFLLENYKGPNENLISNIVKLNEFSEIFSSQNLNIHFLLAPNSVEVYKDNLPPFATPYSQEKVLKAVEDKLSSKISFISPLDILKENKDQYIYFKTDHHWTMEGAYHAYKYAGSYLGYSPFTMEQFTIKSVSNKFLGTYSSRANTRISTPDTINVLLPNLDIEYSVWYKESGKSYKTLFNEAHLDTKDKYAYFLDGNHPLVVINTNIENDKKILVIKDSYAHSFVPFLANHYSEVHMLDLRYYNQSITNYIGENGIDEVLFLFNISTFSQTSQLLNIRY